MGEVGETCSIHVIYGIMVWTAWRMLEAGFNRTIQQQITVKTVACKKEN
jgi:hypothetical protein